jgi:pilus assembly protein CpaE
MSIELQVLVAGADAALLGAVKAAARQLGGLQVVAAPKGELANLAAEASAASAVIAAVTPGSLSALEDFHRLARSLGERKVVAAAAKASGEDVRRLFRAGAADVLTAPFTAEAVAASLAELLRSARRHMGARGRIVSVVRAAGGAGATTLALNMAACLAQPDAKHSRPPRATAVLDLDLQFGDADLALDLQARSSLMDVLRAPERVDRRFLHGVMSDHASGIRLLAPPPSLVPVDALTSELALHLLENAASLYERTFVDLPAAWSDWTFQVLGRSDLILLVAPPTVSGAMRARRVLDALSEAHIERPVFFALNKLAGVIDAFEKPPRIGKTLDVKVDAAISFDPVAARAADRGRLVIEAYAGSKLAKDLRRASARLEERLEALEAAPGAVEMPA